jgi:hypothetical protein
MPIKRAIAALLGELDQSLDMIERIYLAEPSPVLHGVLVRRRRAAVVLRARLSRKERQSVRRVAPGLSTFSELAAREVELLDLFDVALAVSGDDLAMTATLRSLRAEVEQARYALQAAVDRPRLT